MKKQRIRLEDCNDLDSLYQWFDENIEKIDEKEAKKIIGESKKRKIKGGTDELARQFE